MNSGTVKHFSYYITSKPTDPNAALKGTIGITFIENYLYMIGFNHVGTTANVVVNEYRQLKTMALGIIIKSYKILTLLYYSQDGSITYEVVMPGGRIFVV
jgi:hypothetical protein